MKTVKLSDFYPYAKDKGGVQELPHKFKYQILNYWGRRYRNPNRDHHGI